MKSTGKGGKDGADLTPTSGTSKAPHPKDPLKVEGTRPRRGRSAKGDKDHAQDEEDDADVGAKSKKPSGSRMKSTGKGGEDGADVAPTSGTSKAPHPKDPLEVEGTRPRKERSAKASKGDKDRTQDEEAGADVDATKSGATRMKKERIEAPKPPVERSKRSSTKPAPIDATSDDSDSSFHPPPKKKPNTKNPPTKKPASKSGKSTGNRQVISSDTDDKDSGGRKKTIDIWMEVFLEEEEQWMSVDLISGKIDCLRHIEQRCTQPMLYVVAFNADLTWKDVTKRYASSFLSVTRKQRVDDQWWQTLVEIRLERSSARSKEEDERLGQQLVEQPLPKSIGQFKGHPLYALARHLLKVNIGFHFFSSSGFRFGFLRCVIGDLLK